MACCANYHCDTYLFKSYFDFLQLWLMQIVIKINLRSVLLSVNNYFIFENMINLVPTFTGTCKTFILC